MERPGAAIFERAQVAPETLTPTERFVLGVATAQTAMSPEGATLDPEKRTQMLEAAINITRQALSEIRTDPQFSEQQRLNLGARAVSSFDWQAIEMTPEMAGLFADSMLTVAAGLKTPIQARIDENFQGIIEGFKKSAAIIMLGEGLDSLTPTEQLRFLQDHTLHTEQQRRDIALAWACGLSNKVDDDQYIEMVKHFMDQDDMPAVWELTEVKLLEKSETHNSAVV